MNENIRRGDIYWIESNPYRPNVGSVQVAGRPGIVVSNDANNKHSDTLEIVYLTTAPKKDLPTHCTIRSAYEPSTALCEQVTTISITQVENYIGTCTRNEMDTVDSCIAISLGLGMMPQSEDTGTIEKLTRDLADAKSELKDVKEERTQLQELLALKQEAPVDTVAALQAELARCKGREEMLLELYMKLVNTRG